MIGLQFIWFNVGGDWVDFIQGLLMALGIAFTGFLGVVKFLEFHEKILRKEKLQAIAQGLVKIKFSSGTRKVVAMWLYLNNKVFGYKLISWRAAFVSLVLTNFWAGSFILVFSVLYPQFRYWLFNILELNSLRWYALGIYVSILVVDFLSISLSRKVYRLVLSKGKKIFAWGFLVDVCGSVLLYYFGLTLAKFLMLKNSVIPLVDSLQVWIAPNNLSTLIEVLKDFDMRNFKSTGQGQFATDVPLETAVVYAFPEGVFFFASMLTSVWLWGYLLAYSLAFICIRIDRFPEFLWGHVRIEEQPLLVLSAILGYLWVFLVLGFYLVRYLFF